MPDAPADDGDPNTDDIALVERGGLLPGGAGCTFAAKFDNTQAAGWDGLIVFNQPRPDDGQVNMLTGEGGIPGVHMRRVDAIGAEGVLTNASDDPPAGTPGPAIVIGQEFDGWGYAHLYRALRRSRRGRRVKITVLTRDSTGTLRIGSATVKMRAKR